MEHKRGIIFTVLLVSFFYCFLVYESNFHGPDEPIYFSYIASIVEDGDLNVANQMYRSGERFAVSPANNIPDFHNHAGVVLWAPFYLYGKLIYRTAAHLALAPVTEAGFRETVTCALSFSTVLFGFIALMLTFFFCRAFFSSRVSFFATAVLFLGTPFFHTMLVDTGNPNMMGVVLSVLSLWYCLCLEGERKLPWFLYGAFFSVCVAIKTEFWFQLLFIVPFFAWGIFLRKSSWRGPLYFIMGLIPLLALGTLNNAIKYGTLHSGEASLFNPKNFYFFEQNFSPYRGFFYTSPVFYLCILGLVLALISARRYFRGAPEKKITDDLLFSMLGLYLCGKIFLLSFRYAWGGGTPGARILLTEFPVFVLLFARVFRGQRLRFKVLICAVSGLCIFWNWLVIAEYMSGADIKNLGDVFSLPARCASFRHLFGLIFAVKGSLAFRLICGAPLLALAAACIWRIPGFAALFSVRDPQLRARLLLRATATVTLVISIGYAWITGMNVVNNGRNTRELKDRGFFRNAEVVTRSRFERHENAGSLEEIIVYYKLRGDQGKVSQLKKLKRQLEKR
ncbi:MAG: hypothetical protein PHR11_01370 [Candidatus Omnitrophica bacterium]|nr:hypothetical protein [Candidatus Omnitrophota bacterium]